MGEILQDVIDSWQDGVITSAEVDAIPPSASPRAYNSALTSIGTGKAVVAKRGGLTTMNRTPLTGSPAIIGQFAYRERAGTLITQRHLLVSDTGRLDWMDEAGTLSAISASAFTAGTYFPAFAEHANLCFIVNGQDRQKLRGTTLEGFGITRPTVGSMAGAAGAAGSLNGTYELRVTYGNSNTGHESSASDTAAATVTVVSQAINITNVPVSADAQVNRRFIYIRNTATQKYFYRIGTITDNTTTTITVDAVDTSLTLQAPDTQQYDPPPSGVRFVAVHKNRLIVADSAHIYWSALNKPEAFDPRDTDEVNADDGQQITGLLSTPQGALLILKEHSVYGLLGDTPSTWQIVLLSTDVGCIAQRSAVAADDAAYWWAEQGPLAWNYGSSQPLFIGVELLGATISPSAIAFAARAGICAARDPVNHRILFAVPDLGSPRNTRLLPWNTRLQRWESDKWDPMDVASLGEVNDADGQHLVMLGSYAGQVFKFGAATNDGVVEGTTTGTFVASGTSVTTITDVDADFDVVGGGLIERKVTILDEDLNVMTDGAVRPYIVSNDATSITLDDAVSGLTDGATYTYIIGGPDWQFDTQWRDFGRPFNKKRLEFLYLSLHQGGSSLILDLVRNTRASLTSTTGTPFLAGAIVGNALWDTAVWDTAFWSDTDVTYRRIRAGRTCVNFAMRLRNPYVDQPLTLLKVAARAEDLGDKLG